MTNVNDNNNVINEISHVVANVPLGTASISVAMPPILQPQTFIPLTEYEKIKKINTQNENTIETMKNEADRLRQQIATNETIIRELRNTNDKYLDEINSLKEKINELTEENKLLSASIIKLEKDINDRNTKIDEQNIMINEQNTKINEQNTRINNLETHLAKIEKNKAYKKIIHSIQDLNSLLMLETKIKNDTALKSLIKLRGNRNGECHYCYHKDPQDIINNRFHVMSEKINNIAPDIKKMLDAKYPELVDEIKKPLNQYVTLSHPDPDLLDDAYEWWDK